jgi:hypothetical protein
VKLIVRNTGKQCFGKGKGMKRKKDRKVDGFTIMEVDFFSSHAIDIVSEVVGGFSFSLTHTALPSKNPSILFQKNSVCICISLIFLAPLHSISHQKQRKQTVSYSSST